MKAKFDFDPKHAVAHLRARDERMRDLIDRVGRFALQLKPTRSLFEAMLRSIVYQQLHGKAAAAIHARVMTVLAKHGGAIPEALTSATDLELRGAGLSGNKLLAVRDLAAKCLEGTVPTLKEAHRLGDDELVARLTAVRGIGPWTVHMLLIFYLGRGDVLPTGDFAVRLAVKKLFRKRKDPSPALMLKLAKPWRPYRSVASWYLWQSLDTDL